MDSLVYGSNSPSGGNPGAVREEETEKKMTCGKNRKEDRNRGKKEIRRSMPPDMPSGGSTENSSSEEAAAYEVMVKNRIDSGMQSGVCLVDLVQTLKKRDFGF